MDPALALEVSVEASSQQDINEAIERGDSDIQQFYAGAVVFVTGGSGFLGKQLVEKLFRSCDIKKIYLLLRPKKGKTVQERLEEIIKESVFDELRKKEVSFSGKLVAVQGDVSEIGLGISRKEWDSMTEEVTMIVHGAATVNFDVSLRVATLTNVRGTREMVTFTMACKKLKSFVHVSTAYAHATKSRFNQDVLEEFYTSPVPPNVMIEMAETMEEKILQDITPTLIENWPNTYTFTKSIGEEVVRSMADELPVCIMRPAIVISSTREPLPGWLDFGSAYGPSGLPLGIYLGITHAVLAAKDVKIDFVPVDLVNNAIIVAGWAAATRRAAGDIDKKIYTISSMRNFIKIHSVLDIIMKISKPRYSTPKAIWYSFIYYTDNRYVFFALTYLLHYLPAYWIDCVYWIIGKRPMFRKLYSKNLKLNLVLSYFTCNEWKFSDDNLLALFKSLSPSDRVMYNFDMASVDWHEQILLWTIGIRKYIIKDGLKDTAYALRKQFWLRILHYTVSAIFLYVIWKMFSLVIFSVRFVLWV